MTHREKNPAARSSVSDGPRRSWSQKLLVMVACGTLGLLLALSIAACGGGSGSASTDGASSGSDTSEAGSSAGGEAEKAQEELEALYEGTYEPPETTAPAPKANQNVWAIVPGFACVGCKANADGFKEGAEELGWSATLKDGKFDPSVWLSSIREAVRAKADAIWMEAIDCETVKAGLEEAKNAGVIIVSSGATDCEPALFAGETNSVEGGYPEYIAAVGEAQSVWAIAKLNAEPKVLMVYENDIAVTKEINAAAKARLEECESCEITGEVTFTGAELGPPLQQKVEQALLQHPDTTVVNGNYDTPIELGIAAAVRGSGKQLPVLGYEGNPNNIELVRKGEQAMGPSFPFGWQSYAGLDAIIRLQAGESETGNSGIGVQVFDADHNLPSKGEAYVPPIEFRKYYREAWGL